MVRTRSSDKQQQPKKSSKKKSFDATSKALDIDIAGDDVNVINANANATDVQMAAGPAVTSTSSSTTTTLLRMNTNADSDDDDDDDAPVEEVTGKSSRQLVMSQRANERIHKHASMSSHNKNKKRSRKRKSGVVDPLMTDLQEGEGDEEDDADLFREIDDERVKAKELAREKKKLKAMGKDTLSAAKKKNTHITFASEFGLVEEEPLMRSAGYGIDVAVVPSQKVSSIVQLANQPSKAAILLAQKSGTIVDDEKPLWRRTKSKHFFKRIGMHGF